MTSPTPDANTTSPNTVTEKFDPYGALRYPDFRWFIGGNLLYLLGSQMQTVAVMWEIYERTGSKLKLGLVGLAQVVPVVLLALLAGQVADRIDRRRVLMGSLSIMMTSSLGLAAISFFQLNVHWMFVSLVLNGTARAFQQPAKSALLPQLVPRGVFASAVAFGTSGFQFATVVGPGIGGLLIAWLGGARWIYLIDAALALFFFAALFLIAPRPPAKTTEPINLRSLGAGVTFLLSTKLLLGAITLDMFAVLFGGATALLPVYTKDILGMGPESLGWLRAAPGIAALMVSFALVHRPPIQRAGATLLWSVAGFGVATIVFGLSRNFWLAWAMLAITGGLDMISVIIRHTLVQLWTPDAMRGRVSAVNGMFIGISNELGSFESGLVAHLFQRSDDPAFGPTVSVVSGGIGTILVVLTIAVLFPQLRKHGRVDEVPQHDSSLTTPP